MANIIDPKKQILLVKHSYLNNDSDSYNMSEVVEKAKANERYTNGREIVPCVEGDFMALRSTGEPILTHTNFHVPSESGFRTLKQRGIAATLEGALGKVIEFTEKNPDQRLVVCLEAKPVTTREAIARTISMLKQYGIKDVIFDSFYANKLDDVISENQLQGTIYPCSLHLVGNLGNTGLRLPFGKQKEYDLTTVPYTLSFGRPNTPVIYGAVGSVDTLKRLSENEKTLGVYLREREGKGLYGATKMLWNSVTNTRRFRWNGKK